ncbi:MAG: redox-sensing transcriptional repressor Rex [Candidatus Omnitrophica bacterium]|nr:redox-sensing transcriptional repressor Rex [Candidatus Omnitrophota bacterium]
MYSNKKIPNSTIARLYLYLRELNSLAQMKIDRISSTDFGKRTNLSDAQIRKDLNYFGNFGVTGVGYNVAELISALEKILGKDKTFNVGVVGAGSLGSALIRYRGFKERNLNLVAAFDVREEIIGNSINGVFIYHIDRLAEIVKREAITIAAVAVTEDIAQNVVDKLVASGIKCLLNFAPTLIVVPDDVKISNVDMSVELEVLSYFLVQNGQ